MATTRRKVNMEEVEATSKMGRLEEEGNTNKNQEPLVAIVLFARNLIMNLKIVSDALDAKFLITLNEIASTEINKRKMMQIL